jgi:hypothetical protein
MDKLLTRPKPGTIAPILPCVRPKPRGYCPRYCRDAATDEAILSLERRKIMNSLLKNLAIVIGEMNEKSRNEILEKLEERNELFRINFEILMAQLADEGKIKLDI